MAGSRQDAHAYVRQETTLLIALVALAVGFFGGVFFGVYRSTPAQPQMPAPPRPAADEHSAMIPALEAATRSKPDNAQAWIELGNAYFDSSRFEKAIQAYQKALALKPDNADVLTDLGVMYRRNKQPAEALKAFDKAIAADPRHEVARLNKGIVLLHDFQDAPGAIRAWEQLLKVNPLAMAPNGRSVDEMVMQLKKQQAPAPGQ